MRHFAERGYEDVRIEEIAREADVAKGAVFGYFESKAGLFLAAYQAAARSFSAYLDAPPEVVAAGLLRGHHVLDRAHAASDPRGLGALPGDAARQLLLQPGSCGGRSPSSCSGRIPYGTQAFVQFGIDRGEIRTDIDTKMVISLVDWLMDRCQDAIVTEELDPGLFGSATQSPQMRDLRVQQFVELLRSAIGTRS